MLIDSHCHINFAAFKDDGDDVIRRALSANVWLVNVGAQKSTSERTVKIADKYPVGVYAVVGLHPIHLVQDVTESATFEGETYEFTTKQEIFDYHGYLELAKSSAKVVGLGETGLDYYYFDQFTPEQIAQAKEVQQEVFGQFIKMSRELSLPLVLHFRGTKEDKFIAYQDAIAIMEQSVVAAGPLRGVVHGFTGSLRQAERFMELGFYIGHNGIITFKKKVEWIQEIVKVMPLSRILVETDAPFLTPEPYRGQRNEPAYVRLVAQKVAELKGLPLEEVAEATTANARKLFNI